ncbi:MAG: Omp28-related outer membrane protein [Bacteroidota bacterium]
MRTLWLTFIATLFFAACQEVPPTIPSPTVDGNRKVLVEEFSGAKCKPCAAAKADLDNLLAVYGENLIVVTMHTTAFPGLGDPYLDSRYDFRTPEGLEILERHGKPLGIPTAYVNRRLFEGEPDRPLGRQQWAGFVEQEINRDPLMGLSISTLIDDVTRELDVTVTMVPNSPINEEVRLTLMITENELYDKQLTDDGIDEDFEHAHILRAIITPTDGEPIAADFTPGSVVEKKYTYRFPEEEDGWWVLNHCNVVAFATLGEGDALEVLQADEVHLGD